MSFESINYQASEGVAHITFNRPDQLNALSVKLLTETREAIDAAAADDQVRAIRIAATGRAFSSGADLKEGFMNSQTSPMDTGVYLREYYNPLIEAMQATQKPIVAVVQGLATGAGCSVALAADIVVAGQSASFQQIFTNIGLVPDAGSTYFVPRLVGQARAMAAILTGEAIDAERAERWGLIWEVVPDGELEQRSMALSQKLAQRPTRALGMAKKLVLASANNTLSEQLESEATHQRRAQDTADFQEALDAFINKRQPEFIGK